MFKYKYIYKINIGSQMDKRLNETYIDYYLGMMGYEKARQGMAEESGVYIYIYIYVYIYMSDRK